MRNILKLLSAVLVCLPVYCAEAAHTRASLILGAESARPGETVLAGVKLQMDRRWHTYWKNPGASGMPTKIDWQLPRGITAGEVGWPLPEKLPDPDLTTYIYENTVVLLVPLKLAPDLPPGAVELKADVSWLECEVSCIPESAQIQGTLRVGAEAKTSRDAALLETWQKKLPLKGDSLAARAFWESSASTNRPLVIEWQPNIAVSNADFFPAGSDDYEVLGPTERLSADSGMVRIRKQVKKVSGDWPKQVSGLLVQESGNNRVGYEVNLSIAQGGTSPAAGANVVSPAPTFWRLLFYLVEAFVGGLILNVMPCVLPVIALKILGFVAQSREDPRKTRKFGLIYTAGVLTSFVVLASIVIGLKAANNSVGWGFQFGNPYFLVGMTVLVTLIALNLFGVFEVVLGGRTMQTAADLSAKEGAGGAFFNGLLATVLATSCSAPVLAAAVGFAFSQRPPMILLILLTVGLGLASPYLLLSWKPRWLRFLPKPGPWMEKFKIAMGFPMLAAAMWLLSLVAVHYGERTWWLAGFLVVLGLAAWVYGEFVQRGSKRRWLGWAFAVGLTLLGYSFLFEGEFHWRQPIQESDRSIQVPLGADHLPWQPWSPEAVAEARAQSRPVLVDFTARWCLTCQGNKAVLESSSVRAKVKATHTVALLADYTRPLQTPRITAELNRFGRAAVPMVLVYPADPQRQPEVFDLVTPGAVLRALDQSGS